MTEQRKAPGATAIAPGAGSVDLAGATYHLTPTWPDASSCFALAGIVRHRVRPKFAGIGVKPARLGRRP